MGKNIFKNQQSVSNQIVTTKKITVETYVTTVK